jgi:hypothetical protein
MICGWRNPLKVVESVVRFVKVLVVDLQRGRTGKRREYQSMNEVVLALATRLAERDNLVAGL